MSTADNLLARLIEDDELYCAKNLKIRDKSGIARHREIQGAHPYPVE